MTKTNKEWNTHKPLLLLVVDTKSNGFQTLFLFIIKWLLNVVLNIYHPFPSYDCWYLFHSFISPHLYLCTLSLSLFLSLLPHTHIIKTHNHIYTYTLSLLSIPATVKCTYLLWGQWCLEFGPLPQWWIWTNNSKKKLSLFSWDTNPQETGNPLNFYIVSDHPYKSRHLWEDSPMRGSTPCTPLKYG